MNQQNNHKNKNDNFIRYSGIAFEMMAIIGAGTYGGFKLDQWMKNEFKGFTLGFMILSVIAAVLYATKDILKRK